MMRQEFFIWILEVENFLPIFWAVLFGSIFGAAIQIGKPSCEECNQRENTIVDKEP